MKSLDPFKQTFSLIYIGIGLLYLLFANPLKAQLRINISEIAIPEFTDSCYGKQISEPNKHSFSNGLKMFASLISQPVVSKKAMKAGPYDVIIVPGFPYDEEKGAGMILRKRIRWACYLLSEGIADYVIFSGSAVYTPYVESIVMAQYAIELGIPPDRIFCETKAEHSTENIVYAYRLARQLGFKKIALATGPYQAAFLAEFVADQALPVSCISITKPFMGKSQEFTFKPIDPTLAFMEDFVSLKDRESRSERLQGTLGNHIEDLSYLP